MQRSGCVIISLEMIHWTLQPVRLCEASSKADGGISWRQRVGFSQPQMRLGGWRLKTNQLSFRCVVEAEHTVLYLHMDEFVNPGRAPVDKVKINACSNTGPLLFLFMICSGSNWGYEPCSLAHSGGASPGIWTSTQHHVDYDWKPKCTENMQTPHYFFTWFLTWQGKSWQTVPPTNGTRHERASVNSDLWAGSARYISSYLSQLTCVLRLTGQRQSLSTWWPKLTPLVFI